MLDKGFVNELINEALSTGGDFAEVFVENSEPTTLVLIGGELYKATAGRDFGVGIRIFDKHNAIYAYVAGDDKKQILQTAKSAAQAIKREKTSNAIPFTQKKIESVHMIRTMPSDVQKSEKVALMTKAYKSAKEFDSLISQVTVNYSDEITSILVANSEGLWVEDDRVRTRIYIQAVAASEGEMQVGGVGPGAHRGFEFFDEIDVCEKAKTAAEVAVTMVKASYCPGGKMPVVLANGFGGVIFHEACGHGLEATSVAKGTSVFAGKMDQPVASELVTAIDDGTIANAWGSTNVDDEGTPTRKNVLIEKGVLKGYMVDRLNGRRMNMPSSGNARRQSFRYAPTSRMTNTYIAPSDTSFDQIISDTEHGLFAKRMGGGSVNPATGEFNFAVMEGYMIKNGRIDRPVRGATLIGKGEDVLKKIDRVGNDLAFGQGLCGSISGAVPADVGQPTIRVRELLVGGRGGA